MSNRQQSFAQQLQLDAERRGRGPNPNSNPNRPQLQRLYSGRYSLAEAVGSKTDQVTMPFQSMFAPTEMRQLALVAHNHMKPAMKQFIETYSEILKKFRITGTETTMKMCKSLWGEDDPSIQYGLTCSSGPLGGDAQIAALMCMEDLGGVIFFLDPLSAHPHQADIDSLLRLANCGNIVVCPNPASAASTMYTLRAALIEGHTARGMIPSFFETLESPAVEKYKHQQAVALANMAKRDSSLSAPVLVPQSAAGGAAAGAEPEEEKNATEEDGSRRKSARARKLSDGTIDRALFGESLVGHAELKALLRAQLGHDSYFDDGGEEDDDTVIAPSTNAVAVASSVAVPAPQAQAQAELAEVEDATRNNMTAVPSTLISRRATVRGLDRVPMDMGQRFMLDYSTHLQALMELDEEDMDDNDDSEAEGRGGGDGGGGGCGGGDKDAAATITKAKVKVLKDLFGFKSSTLMSSKGKGRMDVKNKLRKSMRKLTPTLLRQYSDSENGKAPAREKGDPMNDSTHHMHMNDSSHDEEFLRCMEQRTNTLERGQSELLALVKQQMEFIEMLKDQHNHGHA